MALHLIKLCVGASSVEDLAQWQEARLAEARVAKRKPELWHRTRMFPKLREDILAGLHRAVILRAMSLVARSGGISDEFTFTGGVARNPAAVAALSGLVAENYGKRTINISADSIYTGALGAAHFARRGAAA